MPHIVARLAAALVLAPTIAGAQDQADLAKASQNPVADLISLPFQNNVLFGVGPGARMVLQSRAAAIAAPKALVAQGQLSLDQAR